MKKTIALTILTGLLFFRLSAQQQFTVTSSKANNYCNSTCTLLDNSDLNGNPTAVLFITAVQVNGVNLDPHPITAYYNGKQWSVMNVDNSIMPVGSQFNVQYYTTPDDSHFVHVVTKENIVKNNSYIDHAGLNGNPKVKIQFFQSASPNVRGGYVNKSEIKFQYDEAVGKWYITNSNGSTLDYATGYSISIPEITVATTINTTTATTTPVNTTSFVPGVKINNSGQRVFVSVVGQTQGLFFDEVGVNRMEVTGFEMENNSPREMTTGMATGKRQHLPIIFEKNTGAASTQFFKAFTTNERLTTVTFEVYTQSIATLSLVLSYKIILTNANTMYFKQSFIDGGKGFTDSIKLTYQSIELNYINGGIVTSDTWPALN